MGKGFIFLLDSTSLYLFLSIFSFLLPLSNSIFLSYSHAFFLKAAIVWHIVEVERFLGAVKVQWKKARGIKVFADTESYGSFLLREKLALRYKEACLVCLFVLRIIGNKVYIY